MKKMDLKRTIIEMTINNALREIKHDPERSIRKLISHGQSFSKGRFSKKIV